MTAGAPPPHAAGDGSEGLRDYEVARLRMARTRVAGGASLHAVLQEACGLAARTLGVDRVGIWLLVDDGRALRCFHCYERSKDQHSEGAVLRAADFPNYFRALEERRDIPAARALENPMTHELSQAYLQPLGIVSMLDAPIYREGRVVGVVCHEHAKPRDWSTEDRDFAGSVADRVAAHLDEAAREAAEARLRTLEAHSLEASKMEALGRLAAGVAHDFRNILSVVVGFAHEIRRDAHVSERVAHAAREIEEAAGRGASLSRELLGFGREEARTPRVIDVAEVVEGMAAMMRTAIGRSHELAIRCDHPLGRVLIDRSQLERTLLNLVLNARDAMAAGGTVAVSVSEARVTDGPGAAGVYVVLEVADTGIGMDEVTRERIFEPFFTTKPSGKGNGIGLSVVYRVVERAGGFLHVESELGRGTRMRVYLPRVAAQD
jgi:signal transduction histidine kinase